MRLTFRIAMAGRMATMFGWYPFLLKLYADGGYQGASFQTAMKAIMAQADVEVVKRSS
jgi:hypothetical protein